MMLFLMSPPIFSTCLSLGYITDPSLWSRQVSFPARAKGSRLAIENAVQLLEMANKYEIPALAIGIAVSSTYLRWAFNLAEYSRYTVQASRQGRASLHPRGMFRCPSLGRALSGECSGRIRVVLGFR